MKYFTDNLAKLLEQESKDMQVPIESLLSEMQLPESTLNDEKINYQQYLFIKSISNSAIKYGLFGLLNKEYEKEINLIDDTARVTKSCITDLLN